MLDYEALGRRERKLLAGLDDSKQMKEEQRERLYPIVLGVAARVTVTARCASGIDRRGLHLTNLAGLADCLERVAVAGASCLFDGFRLPDCRREHEAVVDGDAQ
ncbi:MAG: ribonuclease HII, partial [Solirubrobacterales bacterium]